MSIERSEPCRSCGTPKPIDCWCSSVECADRVAAAQREQREFIFGKVSE